MDESSDGIFTTHYPHPLSPPRNIYPEIWWGQFCWVLRDVNVSPTFGGGNGEGGGGVSNVCVLGGGEGNGGLKFSALFAGAVEKGEGGKG